MNHAVARIQLRRALERPASRAPCPRRTPPRMILITGAFLAAALFSDSSFAGINTWTTGGPAGGWVAALAVDARNPSTIYAGTKGSGVFKSANGGQHWTYIGVSVVAALAIDPSTPATIYAGTLNPRVGGPTGAIFKSSDGGGSWTAVDVGLGDDASVFALAIDPLSPATVYAGTQSGGVFKSSNGGGVWTAINAGMTELAPSIFALAIDPSAPATVYAGTQGGGVFKSGNGGGSWTVINTGVTEPIPDVSALAIDPSSTARVYAGTRTGG